MNKVKEGAVKFASVNDYAVSLLKQMSVNADGTIEIDDLNKIL